MCCISEKISHIFNSSGLLGEEVWLLFSQMRTPDKMQQYLWWLESLSMLQKHSYIQLLSFSLSLYHRLDHCYIQLTARCNCNSLSLNKNALLNLFLCLAKLFHRQRKSDYQQCAQCGCRQRSCTFSISSCLPASTLYRKAKRTAPLTSLVGFLLYFPNLL